MIKGSPGATNCHHRREHEHPPVYTVPTRPSMSSAHYRRILLKVSGEMLAGEQGYGIQPSILEGLAEEIADVVAMDVEVAVVIGGGNIFRGLAASARGMERASADYMGMLATVLNALALSERAGRPRREYPCPIRDRNASAGRRLYSAARHPPLGKETRGDLCRRNGEPLFLHRHRCVARAMEIGAGHHEKAPRSMASTTAIRSKIHKPKSTTRFLSSRFSPRISKSWTQPPSACAWTTDCR